MQRGNGPISRPSARILLALPVVLAALCWWTQPFSKTLLAQTFSTRTLNAAQITNLRVAARQLDGLVLQPGERFSFNGTVGPRTLERGYLAAPSYLEGDTPNTLGGGICLMSSALYRLALTAGFPVRQRVPHLRTIHSVPPGLDATVWYSRTGSADLQFANPLKTPVQLKLQVTSDALRLSLRGRERLHPLAITRTITRRTPSQITVTVLQAGRPVSMDRYNLSP